MITTPKYTYICGSFFTENNNTYYKLVKNAVINEDRLSGNAQSLFVKDAEGEYKTLNMWQLNTGENSEQVGSCYIGEPTTRPFRISGKYEHRQSGMSVGTNGVISFISNYETGSVSYLDNSQLFEIGSGVYHGIIGDKSDLYRYYRSDVEETINDEDGYNTSLLECKIGSDFRGFISDDLTSICSECVNLGTTINRVGTGADVNKIKNNGDKLLDKIVGSILENNNFKPFNVKVGNDNYQINYLRFDESEREVYIKGGSFLEENDEHVSEFYKNDIVGISILKKEPLPFSLEDNKKRYLTQDEINNLSFIEYNKNDAENSFFFCPKSTQQTDYEVSFDVNNGYVKSLWHSDDNNLDVIDYIGTVNDGFFGVDKELGLRNESDKKKHYAITIPGSLVGDTQTEKYDIEPNNVSTITISTIFPAPSEGVDSTYNIKIEVSDINDINGTDEYSGTTTSNYGIRLLSNSENAYISTIYNQSSTPSEDELKLILDNLQLPINALSYSIGSKVMLSQDDLVFCEKKQPNGSTETYLYNQRLGKTFKDEGALTARNLIINRISHF